MVTEQGIEVNQDKVAALMDMIPRRNIKEVQSLNGRITALIDLYLGQQITVSLL